MQSTLRLIFAILAMLALSTSLAVEPDWSGYGQFLQRHLSRRTAAGIELAWLDYSTIKQDARFRGLVAQLAGFPTESLKSREEKLAFHINAYNILAIKTVVDHWPVDSIKDAGNFIFPVWKRTVGKVGGMEVSLDEIEDKLRDMGEPRIHMAIVCASKSCPDLRSEPYAAAKLNAQLNAASKAYLDNPTKGLRVEKGAIRVSRIFDWFEEDFESMGGVEGFIYKYHPDLPTDLPIKVNLPYDWSLNGE